MARVILVTAGSHGDINPFIALARALLRRGHEATLLVNPYFRAQVEEAGVAYAPLGAEAFDLKTVDRSFPDIMHRRRGGAIVIEQMILPTARDAYRALHELARAGRPDVIVHHHICFSAPWVCRELGLRRATVVLAPSMWLNAEDVISPTAWTPLNPPRWLMRAMRAIGGPLINTMFDRRVNRIRRELGLAPERGVFFDATHGGDANLGLWSPALRGPLPGDPPHATVCGFPWHDRNGEQESTPVEIDRFLDAGDPPILFTLGTAAVHVAGDFYRHAARACDELGRRGLLLIGPGRDPPPKLSDRVRAFAYAPFSRVMPRAALNVHHGGIGSTAQALRAARPMLVIPHAHDQFDNAARVRRAGVGLSLPRHRLTTPRLAAALDALLRTPSFHACARRLGTVIQAEDGAARAADIIGSLT
ncbi:MAG: glycosyltransferase [Phycisphaerae bacterium]|nr:glycosyltransferase [Phycisphaerae bacterium]